MATKESVRGLEEDEEEGEREGKAHFKCMDGLGRFFPSCNPDGSEECHERATKIFCRRAHEAEAVPNMPCQTPPAAPRVLLQKRSVEVRVVIHGVQNLHMLLPNFVYIDLSLLPYNFSL